MPHLARRLTAYALTFLASLHVATMSCADPPPAKEKSRADQEELRRQEDERSRTAAVGHFLTALSLEKSDPRSARDHLEKCKILLDNDLAWLPKSSFSKQASVETQLQIERLLAGLKGFVPDQLDLSGIDLDNNNRVAR